VVGLGLGLELEWELELDGEEIDETGGLGFGRRVGLRVMVMLERKVCGVDCVFTILRGVTRTYKGEVQLFLECWLQGARSENL